MQVNRVGSSGFFTSELTLGAFDWGQRVDSATAQHLVDRFAEAGGTLIEIPAFQSPAAQVIGSLTLPAEITVAARVGIAGRGANLHVSGGRGTIAAQVRSLLRELGRESIDLLILDAFDADTPLAETAGALQRCVDAGDAQYLGGAHMSGWQLAALAGSGIDLCAALSEISLLARGAEDEVLPAAQYLGLGVFGGAALGRGVLTGKYASGTPGDSRAAGDAHDYVAEFLDEDAQRIVAGVRRAASALGATPLDVALAWNRALPLCSSIVAPRTVSQLDEILASELDLAPEISEALDQIS